MGTIYWTHYSFNGPGDPLTSDAWMAIRATPVAEHERIIAEVKAGRWKDFWSDKAFFKWSLGIFILGMVCYHGSDEKGVKTFGGLAVFFTFIACISLLMSSMSHASALSKQCGYLREEFSIAATLDTYEAYLQRRTSRIR